MKGYTAFISVLAVLACACDSDEITSVQSESFIKYYAPNRTNRGACVCEAPGGGYVLLGNTEIEPGKSDICLLFTDAFGNSIQDPKYYGKSGDDKGYCIKAAPGGGYVILGSTQDPDNGDLEVWLIRTDDLGDELWTRTFDQENDNDEGKWFDFNSKGDILMVGYAYLTDRSGYSKQIWFYAVDKNGNTKGLTPSTYGGMSNVDEARFVKYIEEDDHFLIAGVSNSRTNSSSSTNSYSCMLYLDLISDYSDAGFIESYDFLANRDTSTLSDEANCLTFTEDKILYLCGTRVKSSGISEAYLCRFDIIFDDEGRFNPSTESPWYYNNDGNSVATQLLTNSDNVYLLATFASGTDKSNSIAIISLDPDGSNPSYLTIGGSSRMDGRNFSFTADGGFIISATNTNKDITDISSMTLIKTKPGGKL